MPDNFLVAIRLSVGVVNLTSKFKDLLRRHLWPIMGGLHESFFQQAACSV